MSRPIQHQLTCRQCHRPFNATLWTSVSAAVDPKLKKELMQGRLFQFQCPSCRATVETAYDLLYHDTNKNIMVWLKHPEENGVMSMLGQPLDLVETVLSSYDLRLVTSFPNLLEKIHCFDNDFDDRVIEMLKLVLHNQLYGSAPHHTAPFYFAGVSKRFFGQPEMDFVSVTPAGEQPYHVPLSPIYDQTAQQFRTISANPLPKGQWLHVNQRYLEDLLSGGSKGVNL